MADYSSSVSDFQWQMIGDYVAPSRLGRKPRHSRRRIVDAIFYVLRSGCPWHLLPKEFPPVSTVYGYFRKWRDNGTWAMISSVLVRLVRRVQGRSGSPSLVIMDSQSVKGRSGKQIERGVDGNKRISGRKRHLLVDIFGLIIGCVITAANIHDSKAAEGLLEEADKQSALGRARVVLADKGYRGDLDLLVPLRFDMEIQIASQPTGKGFHVVPKRWVIERSNAWLSSIRRTERDRETRPESAQAWIYIANASIALRKLEKSLS